MIPIQKLKTIVQGEITTSTKDLESYSTDASVFQIMPQGVIFPKSVMDLKNIVKLVNEEKSRFPDLSITARSGGTDMSGGPLNDSLILDFTRHFNKILGITTSQHPHTGEWEGHAEVQPGVFYRDFEKATLSKGVLLPCYTASKSINTVGGMVGNNSAGEKSLSYGQTKDYVEKLNVVLSDGNEYTFGPLTEHELEQKLKLPNFEGEIYRKTYHLIKENQELIKKSKPTTSKNSAGYLLWEVWDGTIFNLAKLFVGSQGTLGLVTDIRFRLVRPKPKSELLVMFLKDLKNLGDIVHTVVQHKPESFESFDDHTFKLAVKFMPEMIQRMKGNIIKLGLQFIPELWMTVTGGVPKLILIAEFTGETEEEIHSKLVSAEQEVKQKFHIKTHVTKSPQEAQKYWTIRRESFALLRSHSSGLHTAPFIDDIVVHPQDLPEFLPRLNTILAKYPHLIYTIAGHAGDANFHIIPLMDLARKEDREIIPKLSHEVYDLVLQYKGSITAEHNDGLIRTPYLEQMYGSEMYRLFGEVKNIFDPLQIFNPRKKVGATEQYVLEHMKKK